MVKASGVEKTEVMESKYQRQKHACFNAPGNKPLTFLIKEFLFNL